MHPSTHTKTAGRPAANTKLVVGAEKRVRTVRGRGGNLKFRALRLETGNFAWRSESTWSIVLLDGCVNVGGWGGSLVDWGQVRSGRTVGRN